MEALVENMEVGSMEVENTEVGNMEVENMEVCNMEAGNMAQGKEQVPVYTEVDQEQGKELDKVVVPVQGMVEEQEQVCTIEKNKEKNV
jgi:hypothetical protein